MTRELKDLPTEAKTCAAFLCRVRHGRQSMQPTCPTCRADIVRLVDGVAAQGEAVAAWCVVDRIGLSPTLEGRWLDKTPAEVEALLNAKEPCDAPYTVTPLYAHPAPAVEPWPEISEPDIEHVKKVRDESKMFGLMGRCNRYARILAVLEAVALRKQAEAR